MVWHRRSTRPTATAGLSDAQLRSLLIEDPAAGWRAFIDGYTPALLALIERAGVVDRDESMEIYVLACQRLADNDCETLRRRDPAKGSLAGWLAVIVRRAAVDWVRSRAGRRRLFVAVRHLDRFHQRLFELFYWQGRLPSEAAALLGSELRRNVSLEEVLDALQSIEEALSSRQRSDLLSLAARSRAPLRLDGAEEDEGIDVPADVPDPEAALQVREMEERVRRALAALPPEDATIIGLKFWEGLSRPQIQRLLRLPELSEHRVRSIVSALRALLSASGADVPGRPALHGSPRRQDA